MADYDEGPQTIINRRVKLFDREGDLLEDGMLDIHTGPPVGDWVLFKGIRIALNREKSDTYVGVAYPNVKNVR